MDILVAHHRSKRWQSNIFLFLSPRASFPEGKIRNGRSNLRDEGIFWYLKGCLRQATLQMTKADKGFIQYHFIYKHILQDLDQNPGLLFVKAVFLSWFHSCAILHSSIQKLAIEIIKPEVSRVIRLCLISVKLSLANWWIPRQI